MNAIAELHDLVQPKHVVTSNVYFNEMDELFYASFSVNKKPTIDHLPIIGHATSDISAMDALEKSATNTLSIMKSQKEFVKREKF
jgi:hypothetical protein